MSQIKPTPLSCYCVQTTTNKHTTNRGHINRTLSIYRSVLLTNKHTIQQIKSLRQTSVVQFAEQINRRVRTLQMENNSNPQHILRGVNDVNKVK